MTAAADAEESDAPAPAFSAGVIVRPLGGDRFRIESPLGWREVRGYKLARVVAHEIAETPICSDGDHIS